MWTRVRWAASRVLFAVRSSLRLTGRHKSILMRSLNGASWVVCLRDAPTIQEALLLCPQAWIKEKTHVTPISSVIPNRGFLFSW